MKLRDMAMEDGDQQEATTLDTSFQNYTSSANAAVINEKLQSDLNASQEKFYPSTPTSEAGVQNQDAPATPSSVGVQSGTSGYPAPAGNAGNVASAPTETVDSESEQNMTSALAQQQIEKGLQTIASHQERVAQSDRLVKDLETGIKAAEAKRDSYRVALTSAKANKQTDLYTRYEETIRDYDRQILEDKERLKEVKANNAEIHQKTDEVVKDIEYKIGFAQLVDEEQMIKDQENNMDLDMRFDPRRLLVDANGQPITDDKGNVITDVKQAYFYQSEMLARAREQLYSKQEVLYGENDQTVKERAAARELKNRQQEILHDFRLAKANINNIELVETFRVNSKTGKMETIFQPKDMTFAKKDKTFDKDYVNDNGIYKQVRIPNLYNEDGSPMLLSQAIKKDYSLATTNPDEMPFVASYDENGTMTFEPVNMLDGKMTLMKNIEAGVQAGSVKRGDDGAYYATAGAKSGKIIDQVMDAAAPAIDATGKNLKNSMLSSLPPADLLRRIWELPKLGTNEQFQAMVSDVSKKGAIPAVYNAAKGQGVDFLASPVKSLPALTGKIGEAMGNAKGFFGNLLDKAVHMIPPLEKVSGQQVPVIEGIQGKPFAKEIASIWGSQAPDVYRVLQGENGSIDPSAVNINKDGSADTGLLQVNENTFNDFMRRKGNMLKQSGIQSYADMRDPVKNLKMAKIIYDEQGWNAWYGAPDDLRSQASVSGSAGAPTPMSTPVPSQGSGTTPMGKTSAYSTPAPKASTSSQPASKPMNTVSATSSNSQGSPIVKTVNNVPSVKQYVPDKGFVYQPIKAPTPPKPAPAPAPKQNIIQKVQTAAGNAVNSAKNALSKLKWW